MDKLSEMVTGEQIITWLIIAILALYFVYKEWPEFRRRISGHAVREEKEAATDKSVCEKLASIESDIREIKAKLERDYDRINSMERWRKDMQQIAADSLEERTILMEALLGVLGGLQEIGANGPTKEAESKIRKYLNRKAHS